MQRAYRGFSSFQRLSSSCIAKSPLHSLSQQRISFHVTKSTSVTAYSNDPCHSYRSLPARMVDIQKIYYCSTPEQSRIIKDDASPVKKHTHLEKEATHLINEPVTPSETRKEEAKEEREQKEPNGMAGHIEYYYKAYKSLCKAKLSGLVLATTMVGYGMAPGAFELSSFAVVSLGTWMTICSANSINQIMERKNDSLMNRTKKRYLPSNKLSVAHAKTFAFVTGLTGVGGLLLCNPLTSGLALFNLFLYTSVYTPLKQKTALNTWVGAIVGAIPPMIGWAAATGGTELGSWVIAALLAFWQMPHFMALSNALKDDYHRGGFKMLINTNPEKIPDVVLRYSLAMVPIGLISSLSGMTTWMFALDSLLPTGYLTYLAIKFKQKQDPKTARSIFLYSLIMLPAMMGLMLLHKNPNPTTSSATLSELKENIVSYSQ